MVITDSELITSVINISTVYTSVYIGSTVEAKFMVYTTHLP